MLRRSMVGWFVLGGLLVAPSGCNTPTLPLPPPNVDELTAPDAMRLVTVRGTVLPNAFVSCLNVQTAQGVITQADDMGNFSLMIEADIGDTLRIWQRRGTDRGTDFEEVVQPAGGGADAGM